MADERPLKGMSALVTGGGGGIGSASARWLARDGAAVMIMGRTEATLKDALARIREAGGEGTVAGYVIGDASRAEDVERAVAATEELGEFKACVSLVGGGGQFAPLLAVQPEAFRASVEANIMPNFITIRYAAPAMARAGGGSIVVISSTAGKMHMPYLFGYSVGKAAVEMLVRAAAEELAEMGVRVNAVRPGLTRSREHGLWDLEESTEIFLPEKPLGRYGEPHDIAAGVRYLCGPESSWVTGQSFAIDGGHELRRYPMMKKLVRSIVGDQVFESATSGRIPDDD
jgi:NAD(P)-dependent dehydrogenase (short-subunit alcohol dehydrogenase family)